ncbi:MAG: acyl-ACP--UDP-N-acetylglucosamine O-acyltransferase [Candidatus Zixiibacteriota bacterium]
MTHPFYKDSKNQTDIHPTAIVDPSAEIGTGVKIGPYSIVDSRVKIGKDTVIGPHNWLTGKTTIGKRNQIHMGCSIGNIPQDLKYDGEDTELIIGDDNIIREYCTLNLGTDETGKSAIGDRNLLMAYVHVAHDCYLGSDIILANSTHIAGHVTIDSKAIIGGVTAIHQFCRIGSFAMVGAQSKITRDILPYSLVDGVPAKCAGMNIIGLKRNDFGQKQIQVIKEAFKILYYRKINRKDALVELAKLAKGNDILNYFMDFIEKSSRGIAHKK